MITFDFVSGDNFRASLESDHRELQLAMQAGAWKAVHVLAGSIIEALLTDYLIASENNKNPKADPLKMGLNDIIEACRKESIISDKAAQLSHVIRSYRNLIHPGRSVREGETADENGAIIAEVLVKIIVEEISATKKKNYGFTAEQIITKIKNDPLAMAILEDIVKNSKEIERERLLLDIIPSQYFELELDEESEKLKDLEACFRLTLGAVSEDIRRKVLKKFVKLLKEETGRKITTYEKAFFKASDMRYLNETDRKLVKKHLFSIMSNGVDESNFRIIEGLGEFVDSQEAIAFTDAMVQLLVKGTSNLPNIDVKEFFTKECKIMPSDREKLVPDRLGEWIDLFTKNESFQSVGIIQGFKGEIEEQINIYVYDDLGDLGDHPF